MHVWADLVSWIANVIANGCKEIKWKKKQQIGNQLQQSM